MYLYLRNIKSSRHIATHLQHVICLLVLLLTIAAAHTVSASEMNKTGLIYVADADTPVYAIKDGDITVVTTLSKGSFVSFSEVITISNPGNDLITRALISKLGTELGRTLNDTWIGISGNLRIANQAISNVGVYKTSSADVALRSAPSTEASIMNKLKKDEIVKIEYKFYNDKGNLWGKVKSAEQYVFMQNLKEISYDTKKAANYAQKNYKSTRSLCAGFVSESINAGMTFKRQGVVSNLNKQLKQVGFETYRMTIGSNRKASISSGNNKLAEVGDVVIFYCNSNKSNVHAAIITSITSAGIIRVTQSNSASTDFENLGYWQDAHGHSGSGLTFYLLHWPKAAPHVTRVKSLSVMEAVRLISLDTNNTQTQGTTSSPTPAPAPAPKPTPTPTVPSKNYFAKYTGSSGSIVDALKAIKVDSSFNYRAKIAAVNGIDNYSGSSSQNGTLLRLLKAGTLIIP